jgi:hypothetical protein
MKEYKIERKPMISGQGEAVEHKYYKYTGKSGNIWLVSDQLNNADQILVTNNPENTTNPNQGFEGFGGAVMKIPLVGGGIFELHGGWHTNSDAFYQDTGIDIRNRHYTRVIVAKNRRWEHGQEIYIDVLYYEDEYRLGHFDRNKKIAQDIANELGQTVVCYSESTGGSSSGGVKPSEQK